MLTLLYNVFLTKLFIIKKKLKQKKQNTWMLYITTNLIEKYNLILIKQRF